MQEIAQNMGINPKTLYTWCRRHRELDGAIRSGRAMGVECIENAMFRAAVGDWYEETDVTETDADGGVRTRRTRVRKAPSVSAQIFYLKNRAGYRDNPPEAPQADAGVPEDPLSAALDEVARGLDGGRHGS
jgi:transposase-like protein